MIQCPNHGGGFDCSPFCEICEGSQAYDPADTLECRAAGCTDQLEKDTWVTELGFCIEHSNAYWKHELDPFTLERVIPQCRAKHEWIGTPLYCSACGVDKGNERITA